MVVSLGWPNAETRRFVVMKREGHGMPIPPQTDGCRNWENKFWNFYSRKPRPEVRIESPSEGPTDLGACQEAAGGCMKRQFGMSALLATIHTSQAVKAT